MKRLKVESQQLFVGKKKKKLAPKRRKEEKQQFLNERRNRCILLYTDAFIALRAEITDCDNSCNFHLGDFLGDELHSVWYCSLIAF